MSSSGPNYCGTAADLSSVGTITWTNVTQAQGSPDGNASSRFSGGAATTHYLKCTNFGFSITGTIQGILVEVNRQNPGGSAKDSSIKLVKAGSVTGSDLADTVTTWPNGGAARVSYGVFSNLWGDTWTDSEINNSGFGVAISATQTGGGQWELHDVRITITYTNSQTFTETATGGMVFGGSGAAGNIYTVSCGLCDCSGFPEAYELNFDGHSCDLVYDEIEDAYIQSGLSWSYNGLTITHAEFPRQTPDHAHALDVYLYTAAGDGNDEGIWFAYVSELFEPYYDYCQTIEMAPDNCDAFYIPGGGGSGSIDEYPLLIPHTYSDRFGYDSVDGEPLAKCGIVFGGSATVQEINVYTDTSTGGMVFGGSAGMNGTQNLSTSGGVVFGGEALLVNIDLETASGGVRFGGTATSAVVFPATKVLRFSVKQHSPAISGFLSLIDLPIPDSDDGPYRLKTGDDSTILPIDVRHHENGILTLAIKVDLPAVETDYNFYCGVL